MELSINLDKNDWIKYQTYLQKKLQKETAAVTGSFWFNLLFWAAFAFLIMLFFPAGQQFHWPTAITTAVFFLLIIILFLFNLGKLNRAFVPSEEGIFTGEHQFIIDELGISSKGSNYEARHVWPGVLRIERTGGMIMVFLDTAYAFVFPEHKMNDPDAVYQQIKAYHDAASDA